MWDVSGAPQLKDCGLLVAAGVFESTSSRALHWMSGSWIRERVRLFARPGQAIIDARGPFWRWRNTQRRWATWPSASSRPGSARLTAVLDVLVLTSEGRGHRVQTHRLTDSGLVWSCLVSSATPAFSLDAQLVASYEPGFRWCDWTSRFRYAPGALRSQTFLSPLPCLMPCWHDAAAMMFKSLKPGSSPVHQVVEVPVRLFQRTNLFFQAYIFNAFGSQAVSMHVLNSGDSR